MTAPLSASIRALMDAATPVDAEPSVDLARAQARRVAERDNVRASLELKPDGTPRIRAHLLRRLKAKPSPSALLLGPTGVGKTSAAHWLLSGTRYSLVRSVDLANAEREHRLGDGTPQLVQTARAAKRLVLDDVGFERDVMALQDLLDYRYSSGLPTIVTTGMTRVQLPVHIGAAYVRRIVEQTAGFTLLYWDGHQR